MVNTNAKKLLETTKQTIQRAKNSPMSMWNNVQKFLKHVMFVKVIITLVLILWMMVMSGLVAWKQPTMTANTSTNNLGTYYPSGPTYSDPDDDYEKTDNSNPIYNNKFIINDDRNYIRYFNLHRIWFGEESIVMLLFKLWFYTAILWMASPFIRELIIFAKLRMML